MTRRLLTLALVAAVVLATTAACGGDDSTSSTSDSFPTTVIGNSNAETSAVSGDTTDPKNDAYACVLLPASAIEAAAESPAQPGTHPHATVLQGEALTSCTVKSVAECPQNLPQSAPYCDKAYQVQWSVDIYPSVNAAQLTFGNDKRAGSVAAVSIANADEAAYYTSNGAVEVRKGAALVRLTFNGPGSLSGNTAVAARVVAEQEQPGEALAGAIVAKLP